MKADTILLLIAFIAMVSGFVLSRDNAIETHTIPQNKMSATQALGLQDCYNQSGECKPI